MGKEVRDEITTETPFENGGEGSGLERWMVIGVGCRGRRRSTILRDFGGRHKAAHLPCFPPHTRRRQRKTSSTNNVTITTLIAGIDLSDGRLT